MNPLDRLLHDDMNWLLDRLASAAPARLAARLPERDPDLYGRIAEAEARLARLRGSLLDDYRRWQDAIEECEGLWALATLKAGETTAPAERRAA
jgi:hypothetical protein